MAVIDNQSALEAARADWSLTITQFRQKRLPDHQCWLFPENIEAVVLLATLEN